MRVVDGKKAADYVTGRVQVRDQAINHGDWTNICGYSFDQVDAELVCRELGFGYASVLAAGFVGNIKRFTAITNLTCTGKEKSVLNCSYNTGSKAICKYQNVNYASVMCSKNKWVPGKLSFVYIFYVICLNAFEEGRTACFVPISGYVGLPHLVQPITG